MIPRKDWHPSITDERIIEAIERSMTTLDNPGFCIACGEEADNVEPDARNYECDYCGEHESRPRGTVGGSIPAIATERPYSCRLLDDELRKCAFGSCDHRVIERLRKECLRDGGRP